MRNQSRVSRPRYPNWGAARSQGTQNSEPNTPKQNNFPPPKLKYETLEISEFLSIRVLFCPVIYSIDGAVLAAVTWNNIIWSVLALPLVKLVGCLRCQGKASAKKRQEIYNCVVLKVTNVHQVKMNEHDERELNTRSHSFSDLVHRVNTFVIHFNFINYSSNELF